MNDGMIWTTYGLFWGGPYDGSPARLMGDLQPARVGYGAHPGGEYVWDGTRYRWVQG